MKIRTLFIALAGVMLMLLGVVMPATATTNSHRPPACTTQTAAPTPVAPEQLKPYLKLPFKERDGRGSLGITNGYLMATEEIPIAGDGVHGALDFEFLRSPDHGYGKPILASTAGRGYYSYQYFSGNYTDENGVTHQVGLGGGLFLEVRDCFGWVQQYIHVSSVATGIPYLAPEPALDETSGQMTDWTPSPIYTLSSQQLWTAGVPIQQGQVIGYNGDTGIGLDWKDNFDVQTGKVTPRNRAVLKPWDPTQMHFQEYGDRIDGAKQNITDPSGWNARITPTSNPYSPQPGCIAVKPGKTLWLTDRHGKPVYAG